jgi:hypothetical protein
MGGKRPLDVAYFMYHDLYEKLTAFGLQKIEKDKVILKPYIPKNKPITGGCQGIL